MHPDTGHTKDFGYDDRCSDRLRGDLVVKLAVTRGEYGHQESHSGDCGINDTATDIDPETGIPAAATTAENATLSQCWFPTQ